MVASWHTNGSLEGAWQFPAFIAEQNKMSSHVRRVESTDYRRKRVMAGTYLVKFFSAVSYLFDLVLPGPVTKLHTSRCCLPCKTYIKKFPVLIFGCTEVITIYHLILVTSYNLIYRVFEDNTAQEWQPAPSSCLTTCLPST